LENIQLKVDELSQHDPTLEIDELNSREICAMIATKILFEFHLPGSSYAKLQPPAIRDMFLRYGGRTEDGYWKHSAQVNIFKEAGLVAWRRDWHAPNSDLEYIPEHGGYDEDQTQAIAKQVNDEQVFTSEEDKVLNSLKTSLQASSPVIVSVAAGFGNNSDGHQVVVHGYSERDGKKTLTVLDPDTPNGNKCSNEVDAQYFFKYFRYLAIFTLK